MMIDKQTLTPGRYPRVSDARIEAETKRMWHNRARMAASSLKGMFAEILFSLGLVLVGFLISLLGGW